MERTILVRIGEIFLKGNNRRYFENILKQNISENLQGIDCSIVYERNRIIIENFMPSNERRITDKLSKVFGIHSISPAMKTKTDIELIKKLCAEISPKNGIFRVTVNRADKSIIKRSMDIAAEIGAYMLSQSKELRVNLFEYDFEVYVDIRENGQTYIFTEKLSGAGGLPVGCSGKGMLLLSGGIDSPVAGYCMAKRGVKLCAVHYHSFPYTGELAKQKVIDLAKKLSGLLRQYPAIYRAFYRYTICHQRKMPCCVHDYFYASIHDENCRKACVKNRLQRFNYGRKPWASSKPNHGKHKCNQFGGKAARIPSSDRL